MNKFTQLVVVICSCISLSAFAANSKEEYDFRNEFKLGSKEVNNKNFEKGFQHMLNASKLGHKQAQYSLALLYMEGNGNPKDYAQAYLWLNVAAEAKDRRWKKLRDKVSSAFTSKQRKELKPYAEKYLNLYGAESQEVTCKARASVGSHIKRMECVKVLNSGEIQIL